MQMCCLHSIGGAGSEFYCAKMQSSIIAIAKARTIGAIESEVGRAIRHSYKFIYSRRECHWSNQIRPRHAVSN